MKGIITTTRPIPLEVIAKLREHLKHQPRELAWLQLSVNSAFRGGDILSIKMDELQVRDDGQLTIKMREKKTGHIRSVLVNEETRKIVDRWIAVRPGKTEYLFEGLRGRMHTSYWSVKLREWCMAVGYSEPRTATHSLRKTFVKTHYQRGTKLGVLMHVLGHSSERQTLTYCGIMAEDVEKVYADAI